MPGRPGEDKTLDQIHTPSRLALLVEAVSNRAVVKTMITQIPIIALVTYGLITIPSRHARERRQCPVSRKQTFPTGRFMTGLQQFRALLSPIAHRLSATSHRPIIDGGVRYDWRCA
jgi:hypothetical protein